MKFQDEFRDRKLVTIMADNISQIETLRPLFGI